MTLESLSNELLLDLFEHLDAVHLFDAFHGLNRRFNQLLVSKVRAYRLDFRSIAKDRFDEFSRGRLTSIVDRVTTFHLSGEIETPNLTEIFLSSGCSLNQFLRLQSLFIDQLNSLDTLNQITAQCRSLPSLTYLSVIIRSDEEPEEPLRQFIDHIWSLPKLVSCHLDISYLYEAWLTKMSVISHSLKYLTTKHISYPLPEMSHLFQHTPHLQRLSIASTAQFGEQPSTIIYPSITVLNLFYSGSKSLIGDLFRRMPHLSHLTVETSTVCFDGYAWKKMLVEHFPKIKRFRLKMAVARSSLEDSDEQIDSLLDSFRTHFWIVQHRWFVRCHWSSIDANVHGLLYTLPYAFDTFTSSNITRIKSTCPADFHDQPYNRVRILVHIPCRNGFDDVLIVPSIQLQNIHRLTITFPCTEGVCSMLSTLNHLTVLDATIADDSGYAQLQGLLDRASCLYSLILRPLKRLRRETFTIHSRSIRRLEFSERSNFRSRYWSRSECAALLTSSLITQCEVLSIDVEHRSDILSFLQTMTNLRALKFRAKDIGNDPLASADTKDELISWLHALLSPSSTYAFVRDLYRPFPILLWIGRKV